VASLPHDELAKAREMVRAAREIALSKGASVEIQSGLLDSIETALNGERGASKAVVMNKVRHFKRLVADETRRCLDPWDFILIQADGSVRPCCWHPPVGNLERDSLESIVNDGAVVALRMRLLTGDLDEYCASCPTRPAIKAVEFSKLIEKAIPRSPLAGLLARAAIRSKQGFRKVLMGRRFSWGGLGRGRAVSLEMD
jgi:MoaA/NifB/PqqE/SkfB family radical SAM enzyme